MKNTKYLIVVIASLIVALILLGTTTLALFFSNNSPKEQDDSSNTSNSTNKYAENVSIIQLIANPEKYHGKFVRVIGVGNLEFEGDSIWLSKDDLKFRTDNCIWLELDESFVSYEEASKYNGEYVLIEGIFDMNNPGHMSSFLGTIKDISRYELRDLYLWIHCQIVENILDNTYSYVITDYNNNVILSDQKLTTAPEIVHMHSDVVALRVHDGDALSSKWTVFCDLESGKTSEKFTYTLAARDEYVIYAAVEEGKPSIIVRNIFDKSAYYTVYELDNCSTDITDFVEDVRISDDNGITVIYLTGEDHAKAEFTVNYP